MLGMPITPTGDPGRVRGIARTGVTKRKETRFTSFTAKKNPRWLPAKRQFLVREAHNSFSHKPLSVICGATTICRLPQRAEEKNAVKISREYLCLSAPPRAQRASPWRPFEPLLSRQPGERPGSARPRGQGAHEASRLLLWTLRCRNDAASARSPPPLRASSSSCRPTRAVGACRHGPAAPRLGALRAAGASTVLTPSRMMRAPNSRPHCAARCRAGYACCSAPAGAPPRHARAPGVVWLRTLPHAAAAPEATCSSAKRRKQSSGAPAPWCSKTGTACPARRVRAAPTFYAQVDAASPKVDAASGLARQAWACAAARGGRGGAARESREPLARQPLEPFRIPIQGRG